MTQPIQSRCTEYGCRDWGTIRGRCEQHAKAYSREHQEKEYQALYKDPLWKHESKLFRMLNPLCVSCKSKGMIVTSEVVDHIKSVADGGEFWDRANWQALCKSCHSRKSALEQAARRKRLSNGKK